MLFVVHLVHLLGFAVYLPHVAHFPPLLLAQSVQISHQLTDSLQASGRTRVLLDNSLRLLGQLDSLALIIDLEAAIVGVDAHLGRAIVGRLRVLQL